MGKFNEEIYTQNEKMELKYAATLSRFTIKFYLEYRFLGGTMHL